ncbi:MAG TPA: gluconate:H+ symporter [Nocardioides sp.]|jgi:GntP family gluconate:H+ symporter|uniref:GntP family permease n=1 Tax=Nocardioides sp. TaxID=35761 RepID=UPI002E31697A|nr:gluconate:H+ symporter [Nocardioides sp.]HEX3932824.1 gluconate:H+ symporter [Nocardioides sp.]
MSLAAPIVLAAPLSDAGHAQLLTAAVLAIATVILVIVWARFHPLLGLILGTVVLGAVAAVPPEDGLNSFISGVGDTFGTVGLLIALGAMLGKLLADSGGANRIVDTIVDRVGRRTLPWAMALIAAIIGLPMFFEIGVVILVPLVVLVAVRTKVSLMLVGIPALASLSILHGLVPPHPGPLTAIALLKAPLGLTLIFGLIVAVPTLVVAGPLLAIVIDRWVPVDTPDPEGGRADDGGDDADDGKQGAGHSDDSDHEGAGGTTPPFALAVLAIVLPVALMLVRAIGELTLDDGTTIRNVLDFVGEPAVALLVGVLVAMVTVGRAAGMDRKAINDSLGSGLPGVASIMLIVAAGGGFKQVLSDSGVANVVADAAKGSHLSVLFLGWLIAVGIRLATGSATVATVTAAGIVGPLGAGLTDAHLALLVLAIGAGSLFFSHVNDAGFWLVKEYFGMTVGQTLRSWSVMETVVSVLGLAGVLVLNLVV